MVFNKLSMFSLSPFLHFGRKLEAVAQNRPQIEHTATKGANAIFGSINRGTMLGSQKAIDLLFDALVTVCWTWNTVSNFGCHMKEEC